MCTETYGLNDHAVFTDSCEFKPFLHVTWPKDEGQHFDKLTQLYVALIAYKVKSFVRCAESCEAENVLIHHLTKKDLTNTSWLCMAGMALRVRRLV